MRHAGFVGAIGLWLAAAAPAAAVQTAIGYSILEDFEGYAAGPRSIAFCTVGFPGEDCLGNLSGGSITLADPSFPAVSGSQVYAGTSIDLVIADALNYSWPAVHARVTSGAAPVRLQVFQFDPDTGGETTIFDGSLAAGAVNAGFGIGSDADPLFLTRFVYSSASPFALDDLVMGLPDVVPGVPEPGSWAMLVTGFGLAGAILRRRRQQRRVPAA